MLTNAAVLLALAVPAPVTTPASAPPAEAVLDVLHHFGTGCSGDSASVAPSPDRQAVTLGYSEFEVFVGPDAEPAPASRDCTAIIRVTPPAGWTSAVERIDHRGAATLPAGSTATLSVSYQSAGSAPVRADEAPTEESWQTAHRVPAERQVFGKCGQPHFVVVKTALTVAAPDGVRADASVYTTDVATNTFAWKRC